MRRSGVTPWLYVAPTVLILVVYLVYPTVNTFYLSFFDARSEHYGPGELPLALYVQCYAHRVPQ